MLHRRDGEADIKRDAAFAGFVAVPSVDRSDA